MRVAGFARSLGAGCLIPLLWSVQGEAQDRSVQVGVGVALNASSTMSGAGVQGDIRIPVTPLAGHGMLHVEASGRSLSLSGGTPSCHLLAAADCARREDSEVAAVLGASYALTIFHSGSQRLGVYTIIPALGLAITHRRSEEFQEGMPGPLAARHWSAGEFSLGGGAGIALPIGSRMLRVEARRMRSMGAPGPSWNSLIGAAVGTGAARAERNE